MEFNIQTQVVYILGRIIFYQIPFLDLRGETKDLNNFPLYTIINLLFIYFVISFIIFIKFDNPSILEHPQKFLRIFHKV